ncbi:hypothetical protein [Dolichospermum sp. UHCC 0259]|uniref:hypothetical protein n=1 Tax=Dolichospermum sp. UHCC 0259 TaxID=2590010 RepID=UPI001446192A|nr:hypothetical protein [Dolichospermum sp. UHCC 0259]MTJ48215.1 hypothetical protein [Dolichospermum sp. UHCC 0259]
MGILVAFRQQALQYDFKLAFTANALNIFNILKLLFNTVDLSLLSFVPAKEVLRFDISEKDDVSRLALKIVVMAKEQRTGKRF